MAENRIKNEPVKEKSKKKNPSRFLMKILDGSIMTNEWTKKQIPFILFLVLLAVLNIANIISVERKHRQKKMLDKELSILRAKYSFYSGKYAKNIKPSELEKKLASKGIRNLSDPKIKIKK